MTKKRFEQYLNEVYAEIPITLVTEDLRHIGVDTVRNNYHKKTIGTMIRRHDPIMFNEAYYNSRGIV